MLPIWLVLGLVLRRVLGLRSVGVLWVALYLWLRGVNIGLVAGLLPCHWLDWLPLDWHPLNGQSLGLLSSVALVRLLSE